MKNVVECYKHFFGYFNALETNGEILLHKEFQPIVIVILQGKCNMHFIAFDLNSNPPPLNSGMVCDQNEETKCFYNLTEV
jgi:hypothetical protein